MNILPQVAFVGSNVILSVILRAINICEHLAHYQRYKSLAARCLLCIKTKDWSFAQSMCTSRMRDRIGLDNPPVLSRNLVEKKSFLCIPIQRCVIVYLTAESAPGRCNGRWTVKVWELILIMMPQSAIFSAEHSQHSRAQSQIVAVRASWYPVQYRYYHSPSKRKW